MSRYFYATILSVVGPVLLHGAAAFSVPDVTVGRNLQTPVSLVLPGPAPAEGVQITVKSEDPARVKIAAAPGSAGVASIQLTVKAGNVVLPEFWVQGFADTGAAKYSVSGPGLAAQGTVTLAPSGIAIVGPFRVPSFSTTPRGAPAKIQLVSALLDSSRKVVAEQSVAGGLAIDLMIGNSTPAAGAISESTLKLVGGASVATTSFKPAAEGSTTLTITQPRGFTAPAEYASVIAMVEKPGLAITDELTIGKDLQVLGVLCLGEPAPEGGLAVTLTSSDPAKLVLSDKEDRLGRGELTLTVPTGALTAQYYLQSLSDSGAATYKAVAEGFRRRMAKVDLAPSGFIVAYSEYGPPDEATVLRKEGTRHEERRFYASVSASGGKPVEIAVYSAYLALSGKLAADITVQPLRAGIDATVDLKSSDPTIGSVDSPLTFKPGFARAMARFTPRKPGETIISIDTPRGFTRPGNATSAPATVMP